jgi:hypothetical protein
MSNEPVEAEVSELLRSLGTLPRAPALPDPGVLFLRAQIAARQEAAAQALWMATLRRVVRYGLVCAGAAWLLLDAATGWDGAVAALYANPVNAALAALLALGAALVGAAWVVKPSSVARPLRLLGLL